MRRVPAVLFSVLCLLGGITSAEDARAPLTAYEAGPMKDADLIVVGETKSLDSSLRQQFARVIVERVVRGETRTKPLLVHVRGPHPASSLDDREGGGFPLPGSGRHVYFLGTPKEGLAAVFRDAFEADPPVGDVKIAALVREIELSEIRDETRRRRETRDYLIDGLTAESAWMRIHTARDLRRFATVCPSLIRADDEALMRKLLRSRTPKEQRLELRKLTLWLDKHRDAGTRPVRETELVAWQSAFSEDGTEGRAGRVRALFVDPGSTRAMALAWWCYDQGDAPERALVIRLFGEYRLE